MGEVELIKHNNELIIHAVIFIYGDAANDEIARVIAEDISHYWNEPKASIVIQREQYQVVFKIDGVWAKSLIPEMIYENTNPRNNYFRVEEFATDNISFVDGLNCNTGYFKLDNLFHHSTTAAHEFGHTIGLNHPQVLDIRGEGTPGIMYPRGTIVDPAFQYDTQAVPHGPGGTMSPFMRRVLQKDIDDLKLHKLSFDKKGFATIGDFSSIWHPKQLP
jgi:hypothetical protein